MKVPSFDVIYLLWRCLFFDTSFLGGLGVFAAFSSRGRTGPLQTLHLLGGHLRQILSFHVHTSVLLAEEVCRHVLDLLGLQHCRTQTTSTTAGEEEKKK